MMGFWKDAFSEDGQPSSSRIITALFSVSSVAFMGYHIYAAPGHPLPDGATIMALAGFSVSPYTINSAKGAVQSFAPPKP